jgi:Xaa-Pro aminopeptidase
MPMGMETHLRMPTAHLLLLMKQLNKIFIDVTSIIHSTRLVKSRHEIDKIRNACQITSRAFIDLPSKINSLSSNTLWTEREILKELHLLIIRYGADKVPFIVGNSDFDGCKSIINGPTDKIVEPGEIMVIDVGSCFDEYHCDFNRNYAFNSVSDYIKKANIDLWYATEEAINIAKPGITFGDLWKAQALYLIKQGYDPAFFEIGRLGHSIGLSLTELPSVCRGEETKLEAGVVLTLEPSIPLKDNKLLVHEECIVITETGCELLTIRAPKDFYYLNIVKY